MIKRTALTAVSVFFVVACQASAGARVQAQSSGELDANANANAKLTTDENDREALARLPGPDRDMAGAAVAAAPAGGEAMLGARPGLRPTQVSSAGANCKCLRVVVGHPSDSIFTWEGPVTVTNPNTQLAIGLSSEGLDCPDAASDSLGASYHGYELSGNDVIVEVETARLGLPITRGAILPRPSAGGRVVVRAVDSKSPYGRSIDAQSQSCVVWTAR